MYTRFDRSNQNWPTHIRHALWLDALDSKASLMSKMKRGVDALKLSSEKTQHQCMCQIQLPYKEEIRFQQLNTNKRLFSYRAVYPKRKSSFDVKPISSFNNIDTILAHNVKLNVATNFAYATWIGSSISSCKLKARKNISSHAVKLLQYNGCTPLWMQQISKITSKKCSTF